MTIASSAFFGIALACCTFPLPVKDSAVPAASDRIAVVMPAAPIQAKIITGCPPNPIMPREATPTNMAIYSAQLSQVADECRAALEVQVGSLPQ